MAYTTINKSTDHFNTKLYSGNGSAGTAQTGVGFQPDLTWIKARTGTQETQSYILSDSIRGAGKYLFTDSNDAESTDTNRLTSFDSDGFTVGSNNAVNASSTTYVGWNWKAGTTGSGTSTGSGTGKSYNYTVNTTSGFSIVKYTGNGTAGHTIPHHIGAKPEWVIIKQLGGTYDFRVYFDKEGASKIVRLNTSGNASSGSDYWNDTATSSTVVTLGNGTGVNGNDGDYIMYAFAPKEGYCKMGKYNGNGNINGPFVYTGFKPSLVIIKDADNNGENWFIFDSKRPGYNFNANLLNPNDSASETTSGANGIDILSNGFKCREDNNGTNRSGGEGFNYLAIGQSLVGSNNVPCTAR
tara:strand:+ start:665 stop:1726 length:1062 start_codon:yes stop_codon:yes gene_type:complete